ncbi:type VII secretion protein EccB [Streptomyces benahoarensis]|uniref:Type VII secretion protein EccB n=1 Tax=Streptomyces benahoarensis TaxID=2595054 RepID=A0A553ZFS5_9ACTN|nr:type VII secretion protein EccB [Streptomyces benahoarensis]TSB21402.1 type VII secretion protein EccB [Streptomyces benahoarensis]TSB40256.1 type VII secretion protein EccB [Streptomyces benahoarensis]
MASRRDELNAYSFARKRTNAAFLKPLPSGSIESAPRPLKAVLPSVLMGVVILVGFGACGIVRPVAPQGWDAVGENVIVGSDSTTRYVVLDSDNSQGKKEKLLHPVLNLASAKLLLDPDKYKVVNVKESELDGKIAHGPAVGIPFAPDRLPNATDAGKAKTWAVCDRPGSGVNSKAQQAVFVLGGKDKSLVEDKGRLDMHQVLFVRDPQKKLWLVDHNGFKFALDATLGGRNAALAGTGAKDPDLLLRRVLFKEAEPQDVTQQWIDTLIQSPVPIYLPMIKGAGQPSHAEGVPSQYRTIGTVLEIPGSADQSTTDGEKAGKKYVVTAEGVQQVSGFVAKLLMEGPNAQKVHPDGSLMKAEQVSTSSITPMTDDKGRFISYLGKVPHTDVDMPWPTEEVDMANNFAEGSQTGGLTTPTDNGVSCSLYDGTTTKLPGGADKALGYPNGLPNMGTWIGKDYPAKIASGASSYVTPGSGQLLQRVRTPQEKDGSLYLITDTGLRYRVPVNNDSSEKAGNAKQEVNQAALRLGYKDVHAEPMLMTWVDLLSEGPALSVGAARKTGTS